MAQTSSTDYRFYTPDRGPNPQIVITDDGSGGITVEKPTSDNVRGGGHVTWWIENQTDEPHEVTLTSFRVKTTGQLEWPFDNPESDGTVRAQPGFSRIKLKTKDRGPDGKTGTWPYTYVVVVDSVVRDPELVVEWPI
jgi:hypothetical protein